ncbi:MAG: isochorismatase family cysteine hydrolase [Peptococcaceae bacterium]|nr:isochorismatase family cysteine hydrolase [Peptococcaceae bacterium]
MTDYLSPHYAQSVLIIIDFQNDCVLPGGAMEISGSFDVLPPLATLCRAMREASRPIVHVVRSYLPDGSNVDLCRRSAVEEGAQLLAPFSEGADFPDALKPASAPALDWHALLDGQLQALGANDWVLYKPRWGTFYQTPLEEFLRQHGIDTLIFGGCNFPNCPRASIYEASERDFRLVLACDAMSALYEQGIRELKNIGVHVQNSAEIIAALENC